MRRVRILLFAIAALVAFDAPLEVSAQTRRTGDTRGSTRRVGSRDRGSRTRSGRDSRDRDERRGYQRSRRRRWVVDVAYDPSACVYVEAGYCYYDDVVYVGSSSISFGFSLDLVGGVFDSDLNGLWSARVPDSEVRAGLLPTLGGGARAWLLYDRLRVGVLAQVGSAFRTRAAQLPAAGIFEEGSRVGDGWWTGFYAFIAYQPQLSDLVQLWFGARVGAHTMTNALEWNGRTYGALERFFFSAGPELGIRLTGDAVGLMISGFADLAQPGVAQLTVAFVYEEPKPQGAAF